MSTLKNRTAEILRNTAETQITLKLDLDGKGTAFVDTGIGFLDHMLTLFARHGNFDLEVTCKGDLNVDFHHSTEDIGICLGMAFSQALGNMSGITRYGNIILPMDEALILCAADISGRSYLSYELSIPAEKVGTFDTELTEEFFLAFTRKAGMTLHLRQLAGTNSHHIIEGAFKAFGRTMKQAVSHDASQEGRIPSTKGVL
ncbi:MAG: imidazoleglycerol-phosphate dehydratase HisB [Firmicutes bacterium]|nr:imidazoleglycerol-phosphate dehydratase HisB [Bacillota bacterium]MDD7284676.1 imidazoleglycerol-phosphate dehydratase HisB [Bacillota bacterium]